MDAEKWIESPSGYLELIDRETNIVIAREKRRYPPKKLRGPRPPGRPSRLELARVSPNPNEPQHNLYNTDVIAKNIFGALMSGIHFKSLGPQHGCPSQLVIARLRRENLNFDRQVQASIEAQALMRQDELESKVMEIVEAARLRDDPQATRLAIEAFRWLAEQNDPVTYRRRHPGRPKKSLLKAVLVKQADTVVASKS